MKNNENSLDSTVRQALVNLEIPFNTDHWQLMVGRLDALDAADADFDKHLAAKLSDVSAPFVATNWADMANRLDTLDAEDTDFDKNLAHKLTDIEIPFVSSNWLDMSDRLDELDNTENAFDTLIRQRLENIEPLLPDNHWELMADKIEEAFCWRRKIVSYKVVEVALVLFTLFTVGNTLDLSFDFIRTSNNQTDNKIEMPIKTQNTGKEKPILDKVKQTKSFNDPTGWRNRSILPPNNIKSEQNKNNKPVALFDKVGTDPLSITTEMASNSDKKSVELPIDTLNDHQNQVRTSSPAVSTPTTAFSENTITAASPQNDINMPNIVTESNEIAALELPMRKVKALGKVTDGIETQQDMASVATMPLNVIDILKPDFLDTRVYDENIIFPKSKDKKAKWRVNVFGSAGVDRVTVHSMQNREMVIDTQRTPNLGAGIAIGYKKDKLEIETGFSYLDKKYDLPNVEVTTGSFLRTYDTWKPENLHLSIASIPLSMSYSVKETHRLRFYTRLGATFNTLLRATESQFATIDGSKSATPKAPNLPIFEPNMYPKGLLEKGFFKLENWFKGNFTKNSYLTANIGAGVEYRLTHKTDIYLQPTVDYHFKRGIGSLNDRIHSFSIQGGVKTKLK